MACPTSDGNARASFDWMPSASEGKGMESGRRVATPLPPITNRPRQLSGEQGDR
jgi:hypothetical protein